MPTTISISLASISGEAGPFTLFLRKTSDRSLVNAGGDALTEVEVSTVKTGVWTATIAETIPTENCHARIYEGSSEAAAAILIDSILYEGQTEIGKEAASSGGLTPEESETLDSIAIALSGSAPVEPTGVTVFELLEDIQTDVGNVTGNIIIDSAGVTAIVNALLAQGPTLYTALTADETTLRIADEYVQEFTGLGDLTGRDNIAFALKVRKTDADTASLIYLTEDGGLTRVNGAAYATTANGSITVDDEAAGDITVRISSAVTAGLTVGKRQDAVKILITGGNDITKRQGITNVIDGTVAALG
jgi:hypothetical protein